MTRQRRIPEPFVNGMRVRLPRPVPPPLVNALRRQFPKLLDAFLEGENNVHLLMADKRGRPHHVERYIADPAFLTAVRVADSGLDNLRMLVQGGGFQMTLEASRQGGRALK